MEFTEELMGESNRLIVTPKWTSNGHWLVKRSLFTNAEVLDNYIIVNAICENIDIDPQTNKHIENSMLFPFLKSRCGSKIVVDDNYLKMLGLSVLYGKDNQKAVYNDISNPTIIIMPMRKI